MSKHSSSAGGWGCLPIALIIGCISAYLALSNGLSLDEAVKNGLQSFLTIVCVIPVIITLVIIVFLIVIGGLYAGSPRVLSRVKRTMEFGSYIMGYPRSVLAKAKRKRKPVEMKWADIDEPEDVSDNISFEGGQDEQDEQDKQDEPTPPPAK